MLVRHVAAMASGHDDGDHRAGVRQRPGRPGPRLPADPARARAGQLCSPTTSRAPTPWPPSCSGSRARALIDYLTPAAVRAARHRPGGLAAAPPGPRPRLHRSARHHRRHRQARSALPAARVVGRPAAAARGVGRRGDPARRWPTRGRTNPDWRQGYGFQFWMARHGYRGDGAYGQFCVVLPEQQTVVAITGATINMQAVLDGLWSHLLPALERRPPLQPRQDGGRCSPGPPDDLAGPELRPRASPIRRTPPSTGTGPSSPPPGVAASSNPP